MRKLTTAVSVLSFAFIIAAMTGSASADLVVFSMEFSGESFGNSAVANGIMIVETDLLVNPGTTSGGLKNFVRRAALSIANAIGGNGHFSSFDGVFFDVIIDTGPDGLDFTQQLVGQPTGNSTWGTPDGASGDFRIFAVGAGAPGPSGTDFFTITTSGGMGDSMLLTSLVATDLIGDMNDDGVVNLLDVDGFLEVLQHGSYSIVADINLDGYVDLLDVDPFVALLNGN